VLPYPHRFRHVLAAARLARPFARLLPRRGTLFRRLRAMLAMAPASLPAAGALDGVGVHRAEGARRFRVALLAGCAQRVLDPAINDATIRLLTSMGGEVVVAAGAGCCGALTHHMGGHDQAMVSARANIAAWSREIDGAGLDGIVMNASGCGTMVKDYGFMFRDQPEAEAAVQVAALALDVSEALVKFGYAPRRPPPGLTVAYHAACSLQHGQKVTDAPKVLLRKAGFRVVEPAEAHLCCGSAGTYNLLQPDLANRLRERKLENLRATRPDVVATGNIGCMTQLAGAGLRVVHTVELLDWMAGGPAPLK
jgi:glycolate oxidase iron-sulfur subunit